jgi:predicted nucleic acid-binding protein
VDAQKEFEGIVGAPIRLWPFEFVAERAWALGPNATSYDAASIALAEHLRIPLVTHDVKLGRVPGTSCTVDVF